MAHGLFQFCPWSFLPYVCGRLIEIVRDIIYNIVMAFDSCQNLVNVYPALMYCKFVNFREDFIFAKLRSFVKIRPSQNGETNLSSTDAS